jgi:hypothetical protein
MQPTLRATDFVAGGAWREIGIEEGRRGENRKRSNIAHPSHGFYRIEDIASVHLMALHSIIKFLQKAPRKMMSGAGIKKGSRKVIPFFLILDPESRRLLTGSFS